MTADTGIHFYVYGSVRRWSILLIVHRDATQSSLFIILQVRSTCFGCQPHPSSGVHKTVTSASGTGHVFCAATSIQRGLATLKGDKGDKGDDGDDDDDNNNNNIFSLTP